MLIDVFLNPNPCSNQTFWLGFRRVLVLGLDPDPRPKLKPNRI